MVADSVQLPPGLRAESPDGLGNRVWEALGTVRDPELDEPVTSLGFVDDCWVVDGVAHVRLRLPTFFCAPNLAWMMVADARDAVISVEGITGADVRLDDYFASDEVNAGVAATASFADAFAGEALGELDELRHRFLSKAYMAALWQVWRRLRSDGTAFVDLAALVLSDVPASADLDRLVHRRRDLGLETAEVSRLLVDEHGRPIPAEEVLAWLRRAQTVRVNIEGNGELCRGLLRTRYHLGALAEQLCGRRD